MEFFDAVSEAIGLVQNYSRSHYYNPLECEGSVTWYTSMQLLLIPAVVMIIILSFSVRRKRMFLDKLGGRPALVYPMSMLTRSTRLSYMACFGVISPLIFRIVFESKEAIDYEGPTIFSSLMTIVSMLIYSINAFPIFASVTVKNVLGYGLGSLYIWAFTVINIFSNFDCPDMSDGTMVAYNLESLPQTLSLIYLSIRVPYAFILELLRWYETGEFVAKPRPATLQAIRYSYQGIKVNALLVGVGERLEPEPVTWFEKISAWVSKMYRKWVYDWDDTFQFSSRIITTFWIGFILLYYITFKSIWNTTSFSLFVVDMAIYTLDNIGWNDRSGDSSVKKLARLLIKVYYYGIKVLWVLFIFCFAAAFVVGTFSIIYSLTKYKENLKAIQRGDFSMIRPRSCKTNTGLLTSSMKYAGYQVGYIAWAFFIQSAFFILTITIVVIVAVVLYLGYQQWTIDAIEYLAFWMVAFLFLIVTQYLLARFVFLQDHRESVAIDNRRALFLLTYVVYFYNVFVGLASCLVRLSLSLIMGVLNISRLDTSLLPRRYELLDGGFDRYLGFMHVEAYHTHHVMLVFVEILKLKHRQTKSKMLGLNEPDDHNNFTKKKKPATRFQEAVVRAMMPRPTNVLNTSVERNQVAPMATLTTSQDKKYPPEHGKSKKDVDTPDNQDVEMKQLETFQSKASKERRMRDALDSFKNAKKSESGGGGDDTDKDGAVETVVNVGMTDVMEARWKEIRESPEMTKQRRRQAAAFNWLLAYTLMSNPQLKVLRKGILQKRRKDAEMGIRSELVG